MSVLQYPKTLDPRDVQIWDNAAFDNGESEGSAAIKFSWSSVKPLSINLSQSLESNLTKENQSPSMVEIGSPVDMKSSAPVKPLHANSMITNTRGTGVPRARHSGRKIPENAILSCPVKENIPEERNLDSEIEEIERKISQLSSRLEFLRLEKASKNAKLMEKRGRIVAAKFKDPPKQSGKSCDEQRKIEEPMCVSVKLKTPRRGLSMGPAEIIRGARRGVSLGPMEIYSATKLKELGKQDITTPVPPVSNRRKSCYWKLQDIDELRVAKERGKGSSLSPKSRAKTASKIQVPRQAATTIGSKKAVKKEDGVISSIEPKKLFTKDIETSAPAKKPMKSGRVVASRYNQISNGGSSAMKELRKRTLPENEDSKMCGRKRVSLAGKFRGAEQPAVEKTLNKQLEMLISEVSIHKNVHSTPLSVSKMLGTVPKVKTFHCTDESPRDSGPAKRVAELVGRQTCFRMENGDDEVQDSVCHALDFTEEQIPKEYPKIRVLYRNNETPQDSDAAKRVVSQSVGRESFINDNEDELPVFSFEEEDGGED